MATGNQSGFTFEVFHFNVENHMAGDFLVSDRHGCPIGEDVESLSYFVHLLRNGVGPKCVAILAIKVNGFFNSLRHLNAEFESALQVSSGSFSNRRDDPVTLLQHMGTHQLKAGSWSMPMATAYSAVSIGCDSFRSDSFSQDDEPSLHWQQSCQPMVLRLAYVRLSLWTTV